jgi:hypothetical protein
MGVAPAGAAVSGDRLNPLLPGLMNRDRATRVVEVVVVGSASLSLVATLLARANFCPNAGTAVPPASNAKRPPIAQTLRIRDAESIEISLEYAIKRRPRCHRFVDSQAIGIRTAETFVKVR